MAEPAAKKAKTGEEPAEQEQDAKPIKGPKVSEAACFRTQDTTMNVMESTFGSMLMPLTDGGLQYLTAAARASLGIKSGRYAFEVKIVELMSHADDPAARQRIPGSRQQLRVGVATSDASLFLGETEDSICFDMEGNLVHNKQKTACSQKFGADAVLTVVLNLDAATANLGTISLFKDGVRVSQPQSLPSGLLGKPLFPAVSFKQVTVHYNFGPHLTAKLPFTCHSVNGALAKDVAVAPAAKEAQREVLFPVCLPDEGTFDWLDMFLEKNPGYTELSDRAILRWAESSGLTRAKATKTSNDKPETGFGVACLDDQSIRRALQAVAPLQSRNYVVMEVKGNLLADERKELVSRWAGSGLKRKARVLMGEPPADFKRRSQELMLKQKQDQINSEHKAKVEQAKKKRELEKLAKKKEQERAKALAKAKKTQEAIKKKLEVERKKKEAAAKGEEYVEEPAPEEPAEDEDVEEEVEEDPMDEEPPTAELTAEERKLSFRKPLVPDLTSFALSTNFSKFSVPEKGDGFDEITFEWAKEAACKDLIKKWMQEKKTTTRVEDLQPGEWFQGQWKDWQKTVQQWHSKQNLYKGAVAKKAADIAAKKQKRAAAKAAREAKAKVAAVKRAAALKAAADKGEPAPEEPEEAKEDEEEEPEEEEQAEDSREVFDKLDVFGCEDIFDVTGKGEPLFSQFGTEDWTMMSLRFEMHLLVHAFKRDVNDPDRMGIHLEHVPFYYQKYFKKALNTKFYGFENLQDLLDQVRDTVFVSRKRKVIEAQLVAEMESFGVFAMLTEEARRDRSRRVDLGDESAKLKIQAAAQAVSGVAVPATRTPAAVRPTMPGGAQVMRPAGPVQGGWQGGYRPMGPGMMQGPHFGAWHGGGWMG